MEKYENILKSFFQHNCFIFIGFIQIENEKRASTARAKSHKLHKIKILIRWLVAWHTTVSNEQNFIIWWFERCETTKMILPLFILCVVFI